jgi:hypothetical protein
VNLITQAGFPPNVNAFIQSVVGFGNNGVENEDEAFLEDVTSQHMLHVLELRGDTINTPGGIVLGAVATSSIDLTYSQVPVPEPSTWLLFGAGASWLALWKRLHKRAC